MSRVTDSLRSVVSRFPRMRFIGICDSCMNAANSEPDFDSVFDYWDFAPANSGPHCAACNSDSGIAHMISVR